MECEPRVLCGMVLRRNVTGSILRLCLRFQYLADTLQVSNEFELHKESILRQLIVVEIGRHHFRSPRCQGRLPMQLHQRCFELLHFPFHQLAGHGSSQLMTGRDVSGVQPICGIKGHFDVAESTAGGGAQALQIGGHYALRLQVGVVPVQFRVPQVAEGAHVELKVAVHVTQF